MPTLICKPSSVGVLPMLGRGECFSHKILSHFVNCIMYHHYVGYLCRWAIIINPCDIIFNLLSGLISDWHKFIWGGEGSPPALTTLKRSAQLYLSNLPAHLREVAFLKGITYFDLRMLRRVMLRIWCSERILTMF